MRKLPLALDNPLDTLTVDVADIINPALKETGHTANMLTTYSAASSVMALVALHNDNLGAFAVLWSFHAFWDCADGNFARSYNQVTKFGDLYDHATDVLSLLGLFYMIFTKYDLRSVNPFLSATMLAVLGVSFVQLGCQQKYIGGTSESLDSLQYVCRGKPDEWLSVTRWFGHGTMQVVLLLFVWYLHTYHRKPKP